MGWPVSMLSTSAISSARDDDRVGDLVQQTPACVAVHRAPRRKRSTGGAGGAIDVAGVAAGDRAQRRVVRPAPDCRRWFRFRGRAARRCDAAPASRRNAPARAARRREIAVERRGRRTHRVSGAAAARGSVMGKPCSALRRRAPTSTISWISNRQREPFVRTLSIEIRTRRIEDEIGQPLALGLCTSAGHADRDRDEGVLRMFVGDGEDVAPLRARPHRRGREESRGQRRLVHRPDQTGNVGVRLDVGRILDDDVRHDTLLALPSSTFLPPTPRQGAT